MNEVVEHDGRGAVAVERMSRTQRTIAQRMVDSRSTVPSFTLTTSVDMTAAVALRDGLKEESAPGTAIPSINDLVVKACALALREHPRANGAFRDGSFEQFERVNVGVAVSAQDALLVPTVFDADRRSLTAIAAETRRLSQAARERTITAAELADATFTVSNLGMYRVHHFDAVINPPQAAILAVGTIRRVPVVRDEAVVAGQEMALTLTCDHRVLYGADGARFLGSVCEALEVPERL